LERRTFGGVKFRVEGVLARSGTRRKGNEEAPLCSADELGFGGERRVGRSSVSEATSCEVQFERRGTAKGASKVGGQGSPLLMRSRAEEK